MNLALHISGTGLRRLIKVLRTFIIASRRSSSSRFHSRRSHCHLPRKAARQPGASRNRPDHKLRPLPAEEERQ